jgi:hypothetical protein
MFVRFLFITLFSVMSLFAQQKALRFTDGATRKPVADADVYTDSVFVAPTNFNGNVNVNISGSFKNIIVSHIAYKKRVVPRDSLLIKKVYTLERKVDMLEEVLINSQINKDSTTLPNKNTSWGQQLATFIPYKNEKYISKLKFRVVSVLGVKGLNFLPFKANLHEYDTIAHLPGKPILEEDLLVENQEGRSWVEIDISSFKIKMPKQGIVIVFKIPLFEEGLYKVDFIQSKGGLITATPMLKYEPVKKGYFSFQYADYLTDGSFISKREWRRVRRDYFLMDLVLEGED